MQSDISRGCLSKLLRVFVQISPTELQERLTSDHPPHLLDVREVHENEFVALPNSCLIPLGQLAERVDELTAWRDEPVVVYCHHGIRSQHAISLLQSLGFNQLENLQGGIDAWSVLVDSSLARY